jgi:hypothetical protein
MDITVDQSVQNKSREADQLMMDDPNPQKTMPDVSCVATTCYPSTAKVEENIVRKVGWVKDDLTVESKVITPSCINSSDSINDVDMNDIKSLGIPIHLQTFQWSAAQGQNTVLYSFMASSSMIGANPNRWQLTLQRYRYWRADIEFQVVVNGTKFHAGKLLIHTQPVLNYPMLNSNQLPTALVQRYQLPHTEIYASSNTSSTMNLTWLHYAYFMESLSATNFYKHNQFNIVVSNPLNVGAGASTAIQVSVYARLTNIKLKIPIPSISSQAPFLNFNNVSTTMQNVRDLQLPVNITGDDIDGTVHGMDLPLDMINPMPMVRRIFGNPSNVQGVTYQQRLCLYPSTQNVPSTENFNTLIDEMLISNIIERPGFLTSFNLSATNLWGSAVWSAPISPCGYFNAAASYAVTPLMYCSQFFEAWRGELVYTFEFITTLFTTIKVFAAINYGSQAVPSQITPGSVDATTGYGVMMEVSSEKNIFEVRVPFEYLQEFCLFKRNNAFPTGAPIETWDGTIGTIALYVVNPFVFPAGVPTSIAVNVYHRAGKDFEFQVYNPMSMDVVCQNVAQGPLQPAQTGSTQTELSHTLKEKIHTFKDLIKRPIFIGHFPLQVDNNLYNTPTNTTMAGYMRRQTTLFYPMMELCSATNSAFAKIASMYKAVYGSMRFKFALTPGSAKATIYIVHVPPNILLSYDLLNDNNTLNQALRIDALLNAMFPWRQQVNNYVNSQFPGNAVQATVPWNQGLGIVYTSGVLPVFNSNRTTVARGIHLAFDVISDVSPSCEIEIPYYSNQKFIEMGDYRKYGAIIMFRMANTQNTTNIDTIIPTIDVTASAGDDMRFGQFVGTPTASWQTFYAAGEVGDLYADITTAYT